VKKYLDRDGTSGVVAYAIGDGFILIEFAGREGDGKRTYRYTNASCGAATVVTMQRLAAAGRGLSTFVALHDPAYATRSP
jgi:hypothetical protein